MSALVDAACRAADWDTLHDALSESRALQLHFDTPGPLTRAFEALAFHQEWERLQALHALLPTMAIDRVSTSRLHYKVSAIRGQNRTPT